MAPCAATARLSSRRSRGGLLTDAKHWIITAVVFEPLNRSEAPAVLTALKAHQDLFHRLPERIGLDSAFDRILSITRG